MRWNLSWRADPRAVPLANRHLYPAVARLAAVRPAGSLPGAPLARCRCAGGDEMAGSGVREARVGGRLGAAELPGGGHVDLLEAAACA
jgi:hypothetical protein